MDEHILDSIEKPSDVKKLDSEQTDRLCAEIRNRLIDTVSQTGGHLASNLGVVELTVALHKAFNSPYDKIIWDVGHQVYVHKLLTGRQKEFSTLRQPGGLSGFSDPDESEHDIFYSGHSSTSLSAAYGIAQANKLKNNKNYTIAVIGDGAFTGGMVYEALNNAGRTRSRLIVVLNDNDMSISKNVGALASHLAVIKARPSYFRMKAKTESALNRIPFIGVKLSNFLFNIKTRLKSLFYKNSTMFEELGFRYIGPLDGHNVDVLTDAFEAAKTADYPMLIHIKTKKGKGYEFAEQAPSKFHGIGHFDIVSGEFKCSADTFSSEFGASLCSFADNDKRICAVTAAMGIGTGLDCFAEKYPQRFFDVGIAEEHAVTFSAGLSRGGMVPVFAVYSAFLQRTYDQVIHDAALQGIKLVLAIDRAGFVDGDGPTHHGLLDVPMLNTIPGVTIFSPSTYKGLRNAFFRALYHTDGVVAVRYPKGEECEIPPEYEPNGNYFDEFGDGDADIAIVTYGRIFAECAYACEDLRKKYKIKLIKLNRIKPIDDGAVTAVLNCSNVFFYEEGELSGGIGESFNYLLSESGYKGGYFIRAVEDRYVKHSTAKILLKEYGFDRESIVNRITEVMNDVR